MAKPLLRKISFTVYSVLVFAGVVFSVSWASAENLPSSLEPGEIITADDLRTLQLKHADFALFDARGKAEYEISHIEGAVLPMPSDYYKKRELFKNGVIPAPPDLELALTQAMNPYSKDQRIITYCNRNCTASSVLLQQLKKSGFKNVQSMEEGLQSWQEKSYPVAIGVPHLSSDEI